MSLVEGLWACPVCGQDFGSILQVAHHQSTTGHLPAHFASKEES